METYHLSDSEYRFMQVVWDAEPVGSGELVALCREKLGWKKSTTYTVLKKLGERGLVQNEESVVTALVGSEMCIRDSFMGGRKLTEREAEDLKRLIDQYQEG